MNRWKGTIIILPIALLLALTFFLWTETTPPPPIKITPKITLADLRTLPDWSELDRFQNTISRETFLQRLDSIYAKDHSWKQWIHLEEDHARILYGQKSYSLKFALTDQAPPGSIWNWKSTSTPTSNLPLTGLHIALDPGHIGGAFSEMEERHHQYDDLPPIREGSMTLLTAQHLRPLLEEMGATVSLVRTQENPVTTKQPSDFANEKLFYRTSEIRARADLVNQELQPDLIICLHFNASGSPVPLPGQHFHIILNGAYHSSELKHQDERFQMLQRLLSRTYDQELPLATAIAKSFVAHTGLPPYEYPRGHPFSIPIDHNPYLWARNLLANRLYQCPVIFLEPYVMNSTDFIYRFKEEPDAIYREYAQAVAQGIMNHFSQP